MFADHEWAYRIFLTLIVTLLIVTAVLERIGQSSALVQT